MMPVRRYIHIFVIIVISFVMLKYVEKQKRAPLL